MLPWSINGNPNDPVNLLVLTLGGSDIPLTLGNFSDYKTVDWFINDKSTGNKTNTYVLKPSDFNRFDIGIQFLTIEVETNNGIFYNRTIPFRVAE